MRTTTNFAFYCRESKKNKQGLAPVELSIIINGKRHFYNLALKCSPKEFNRKRRPQIIEDYLTATRLNINECLAQMAQDKVPVTADNVYEFIRTGGVRTYTIANLFADYEDILKKRIGVDMDIPHYRKYELTREKFFEVVDSSREAHTISNADILTFRAYITSILGEGTIGGYMSRLKAYIRFGRANDKIKTDPFQEIKIKRVEKPVQTISEEELQKIIKKEISNDRLNKVRELFVFACGSGLAFADVMQLTPEDFTEQDGKLCIFKERQKTGVKFYSVLLPCAVAIAEKYGRDLSKLKLSNQKCNAYLKEIQAICDVNSVDSLTFHKSRHFYATYAINSGIPLEIVQKLVGHSNIKQTLHYARLMQTTIVKSVVEHCNF